jgi:hypothetical protein
LLWLNKQLKLQWMHRFGSFHLPTLTFYRGIIRKPLGVTMISAWVRPALCGGAMLLALGATAQARTFISGLGNDANTASSCPRTNPCRTLAGAYSVTPADSEIIALDGAGYGAVTISHAVALVGFPGATISAPSGGAGITITGGATVTVRSYEITGSGAANTTGITITGGTLNIYDSVARNLTTGMAVNSAHVMTVNTHFTTNTTAIRTTGAGVDTSNFPRSGTTWVLMYGGTVTFNTTAFFQTDPGANKYTILSAIIGNGATTFVQGNPLSRQGQALHAPPGALR